MKRFYVQFLIIVVVCTLSFSPMCARVVSPGESLWNLQKLLTQASCDATISQTDFTAGVKTISQNGVYALAESVIGKIVISANNVVLDLNGKTITNTSDNAIVVNGVSKCSILNGMVSSTTGSGILSNPGTSQLNIEYISANSCVEGIRLEDTVDAQIENCELVSSTTGITLSNASNVSVLNTVASSNSDAGFSLFSSEKNLIRNCKSFKTGAGQTNVAQNVYGFVSDDGQGNIFDSCIAQSTLATTVTDSSAVVASFALTGTETNSEISNCKSDIVQTGVTSGFAVPYGIWLERQYKNIAFVVGADQGVFCEGVAWSPNGAYIASVGNNEGIYEIQMFYFDRIAASLILTDHKSQGVGTAFDCRWYPDGTYLATAGPSEGGDVVQIFSFNATTGKLTKTDGVADSSGRSAEWSSNGSYFAIGGTSGTGDEVKVFSFNATTGQLTETDAVSLGTSVFLVRWSPDGNYLAAIASAGVTNEIQIYSFNHSEGTLTPTDSKSQGTSGRALAWSPDGKYFATGGTAEAGNEVQIFSFDSSDGTLTLVDGASQGTECYAVVWSPDGAYFASAGLRESPARDVQIFSFDPVTETITLVDSVNQGTVGRAVEWSPDGAYFAIGGSAQASRELRIFTSFQFPTGNVIKNNIVHGASGGVSSALGVGICGSSIENMIIGNFAYDNASFNYQFVPNVFDQRFDSTTSDVKNISMKTQNPVYAP